MTPRTAFSLLLASLLIGGTGCDRASGASDDEPGLEVCETWGRLKVKECRGLVISALQAPRDPNSPAPRLTHYTLYDQCVLFPERRKAIGECVDRGNCYAMAGCVADLVQADWRLDEAPDLCEAYRRRKAGVEKTVWMDRYYEQETDRSRADLASRTYDLSERCDRESDIREALTACMDLSSDERFSRCVVDLADDS